MVSGRLVATVIVGVWGLTACAVHDPGFMRRYACPGMGAVCNVPVTVVVVDGVCRPKLVNNAQNTLDMPPHENNVVIRWVLDASSHANYEFRNDGFDLKTGTTDQFPARGRIMGGKGFQVINVHTNTASYEYYLLVHHKSSAQTCKLDPFINNVN